VRNVGAHRTDDLPKVVGWSSQHFTEFVFDGALPLDPLKQESDSQITRLLRRKLRALVEYVNTTPNMPRGMRGWTVIGWYRRGTKADGANTGNSDDKVATEMERATMHIVRIEPTHITKEQLGTANLLLPVSALGATANMDQIRQANVDAAQSRPS